MSESVGSTPPAENGLEAFWAAASEGRLLVQRCDDCSYPRWPPGPVCPECQSCAATWSDVSPTGSLWSFAEYQRAFDPKFASEVPYTVGLIQLDAGPRMYGMMARSSEEPTIGQRVRATFHAVVGGRPLIRWQKISPG